MLSNTRLEAKKLSDTTKELLSSFSREDAGLPINDSSEITLTGVDRPPHDKSLTISAMYIREVQYATQQPRFATTPHPGVNPHSTETLGHSRGLHLGLEGDGNGQPHRNRTGLSSHSFDTISEHDQDVEAEGRSKSVDSDGMDAFWTSCLADMPDPADMPDWQRLDIDAVFSTTTDMATRGGLP